MSLGKQSTSFSQTTAYIREETKSKNYKKF